MSICAAHCSWVCCSKSTSRITSYSSSVSSIGSVSPHPLGQKVSTCGTSQIRRHLGGLGMDAFLLYFRYIPIITLQAEKNNNLFNSRYNFYSIFAFKSLRHDQEFFLRTNCKDAGGSCEIHYIRDVILEDIVKEAIGGLADFVK